MVPNVAEGVMQIRLGTEVAKLAGGDEGGATSNIAVACGEEAKVAFVDSRNRTELDI